jgi:hypothetical protein
VETGIGDPPGGARRAADGLDRHAEQVGARAPEATLGPSCCPPTATPAIKIDYSNREQLNALFADSGPITHEEEIAAFARRVVRLRDGRIVSDTAPHDLAEAGA